MSERPLRWDESDLDRCKHGRHSVDSCYDCPGEKSTGNLFLLNPSERPLRGINGATQIRIGTCYDGRAIWVTVRRVGRLSG